MNVLLIQYDSFEFLTNTQQEMWQRRNVIKRISGIQRVEAYDVYLEGGRGKRIGKKMLLEYNGRITVLGESDDNREMFTL